MNGMLLLSWLIPLLVAFFASHPARNWAMVLAPLPALLTALSWSDTSQLTIPWLLLGAQFGLDSMTRMFLLFSALLWLIAGLQIGPSLQNDDRKGRFQLFFLLAMAGNFWLIVAQDMVNFYLGFSLMGLAAYGLVIHDQTPGSLHAGRVYLSMTLVAETALFAALLLIYQHTESLLPNPVQLRGLSDWAIGLLVFGLGIKAGLILLHVWLPLAHPAAPVPASAVLSGSMIKAALIGWLKFLPLGQQALEVWGQLLAGLGTLTLLFAVAVGLLQTNPKVVLAYSSVSKMGLMTVMLGLALGQPQLAPAILSVLVFYAALHGLAKGALFLGVGVTRTSNLVWLLPVLALPALVLAGAPFTAGALTKVMLEPSLSVLNGSWTSWFPLLLILSSLGTTLLLGRFLVLMRRESKAGTSANFRITLPWLVLIGLLLGMPWLTEYPFPTVIASWPLALGIMLVLIFSLSQLPLTSRLVGCIPAGDILQPVLSLSRLIGIWIRHALRHSIAVQTSLIRLLRQRIPTQPLAWRPLAKEQSFGLWPIAGILVLLMGSALLLLLRM